MSRNMLLGAACLLLVGLLIGYMAGSSGPSLADIDRAVSARVNEASQAQADRVVALETKMTQLGGRVDAIGEQVKSGAEHVRTLSERVGTDIADLGSKLGDSVSAAGASSLEAIRSRLDELQNSLAAIPAAAPATTAPAGQAQAPIEQQAQAPAQAASGAPVGSSAGQTVALSDNARAFISRVDDAAGEAIVYVNGSPTTLKVGQTVPFQAGGEDCQLTLTALDRGHASIDGACGADLPEASGTPAGTVTTLADGAVRIFVSAVEQEGARIAVNGFTVQEVAVGESVDVAAGDRSCKVTVTGVDRGHVALDATCS